MKAIRFKPKIDKLFYLIWIPTTVLLVVLTVLSITSLTAILIMACTDVFTFYFMVSSLIGYVELREKSLFVRFGFVLKREIPYERIRKIEKGRGVYTETMLSLKNSLDHINIRYNKFDVIAISVINDEDFVQILKERIDAIKAET